MSRRKKNFFGKAIVPACLLVLASGGMAMTEPDAAQENLIRFGKELIVHTYAHIGPEVADPARRYAGNNLACGNCHLSAGTKKFGLSLTGVFSAYPQYQARSGGIEIIEDRINDCMIHSLNGRTLPADSPEMKAMVAYLRSLPQDSMAGHEIGAMPELSRPADPVRGELRFGEVCVICHRADGAGQRHGDVGDAAGYVIPPLWGPDSFNTGAGMNRLIYTANFIHDNMPFGTDYTAPAISAEEAWDIAAFIDSQPRPAMANLAADYPKRLEKPVDIPYGPYTEGFDEAAHRLGPFVPIRAALEKLRDNAGGAGAQGKNVQDKEMQR